MCWLNSSSGFSCLGLSARLCQNQVGVFYIGAFLWLFIRLQGAIGSSVGCFDVYEPEGTFSSNLIVNYFPKLPLYTSLAWDFIQIHARVFESSFIIQEVTDLFLKKADFSPSWIWNPFICCLIQASKKMCWGKIYVFKSSYSSPSSLALTFPTHSCLVFPSDLVNTKIRECCKAIFMSLSNQWRRLSIKKIVL